MKFKKLFLFISLFSFFFFFLQQNCDSTPSDCITIIGHRGSPTQMAENTLPALKQAIKEGANAVEIDLCLTKDGHVVVWHDWDHSNSTAAIRETGMEPGLAFRPWVPNLGNKYRKPINQLTLKEFKDNYGYTSDGNFLGGAKRDLNFPVLTLEEFCKWAASEPRLEKIYLDLKAPANSGADGKKLIESTLKLTEKYGLTQKSLFSSPEKEVLAHAPEIREKFGDVAFAYDTVIVSPTPHFSKHGGLPEIQSLPGVEHLMVGLPRVGLKAEASYLEIVQNDLIKIFEHNEKIRRGELIGKPIKSFTSWTIDDPEMVKKLLLAGVDTIMTNKPEMVKKIHQELLKFRPSQSDQKKKLNSQIADLEHQRAVAKQKVKNRPWWKFWLRWTKSDEKALKAIELQLNHKKWLLKNLEESNPLGGNPQTFFQQKPSTSKEMKNQNSLSNSKPSRFRTLAERKMRLIQKYNLTSQNLNKGESNLLKIEIQAIDLELNKIQGK